MSERFRQLPCCTETHRRNCRRIAGRCAASVGAISSVNSANIGSSRQNFRPSSHRDGVHRPAVSEDLRHICVRNCGTLNIIEVFAAVCADIPQKGVRKSGTPNIIEVLAGLVSHDG